MAISGPGAFALTFEKMFINTAAQSMEAETHKELMTDNSYTPNYDTHAFRSSVTNEVTGTGYSAGGVTITTTDWTIASNLMTYDFADTVYTTVTVSNAISGIFYFNVGTSGTDQLLGLQYFVTAASATAANFTIQHPAAGVMTLDHVP